MVKRGLSFALVVFIIVALTGCSDKNDDRDLVEIAKDCVKVTPDEVEMKSADSGEVVLNIVMPDYALLYQNALSESSNENEFEENIRNALSKKKYEEKAYETIAEVSIKDGEEVVHSEEAVQKIMEEALIDAINAVVEYE